MIRYTQFFSFVSLSLFSLLLFFFDFIYSAKKESVHLKQCRRVVLAMTISRLRNGFERSGASERSGVLRRFFFVHESARARARKESVHLKRCRRVLLATTNEPSGILTERFTIYDLRLRFTIYDLLNLSLLSFVLFLSMNMVVMERFIRRRCVRRN